MANRLKKIKGYVPMPIENIHQHLQEVNRGKGSPQPGRGKGSYKRQDKHRGGVY